MKETQFNVHLEGMLVVDAFVKVNASSAEEALERALQKVQVRDEPDPFPACGVDRLVDYEDDKYFEGPDDPTYVHYIQPVTVENLTTGEEWAPKNKREYPTLVPVLLPRERVQTLLTMLAYYDELGKRVNDERFSDRQEWINDEMNDQITELGECVRTIQSCLEATKLGPLPEKLTKAMGYLKRHLKEEDAS